MTKYRFGREICLKCGRLIGLTRHGQLRRHVRVLNAYAAICEGAWEWPHKQREAHQEASDE